MLKIIGNQLDLNGEKEGAGSMEFITEGRFYNKGGSMYLVYEESEFSGIEGMTTSLKVTGGNVKMKRYGDDSGVEAQLEFEKGRRINGLYETPFGPIGVEVLTHEVNNRLNSDGSGKVDIDYFISLKGLSESRSKLSIEIMK
jgi:uncharacterized beta-barrel protein YwiB (DUF1934 family)